MSGGIQAHLPDGRILEFPDGTDPAVIQGTVKKILGAPQQSDAGHMAGMVGESALRGVTNTYGSVGDITDMASRGVDWLGKQAGLQPPADQQNIQSQITGKPPTMHNPITGGEQPIPKPNYFMSLPGAGINSEALRGVATKLGLLGNPQNQPQNRTEDYLSKAAEFGAGAASLPIGGGSALVNMIKNGVSGVGAGLGGEAARDLFPNSQIAPLAGQLGGAVVGSGVANLGQRLANFVKGDAGVMGDFQKAGITPRMAGDVTDSKFVKGMQNALRDSPGGADRIQSAAQQQIDDLAGAVNKQANQLGTSQTKTEIGTVMQGGAKQAVQDFRDTQDKLYRNVSAYFRPDDKIDITKTMQTLADVQQAMPGAPETAKLLTPQFYADMAKSLANDAPNGQMTYQAFSRMRTEIGRKLGQPQILRDVGSAELARLYGAVSEDLMQAATQRGPQALNAVQSANGFTREGMKLIKDNLNKIIDQNDPAKVLDVVLSGSPSGGKYLNTLKMSSYTPDEWKDLSGYVLRNMGKAAPGMQNAAGDAFSPSAFMTNWNKLSPEAKGALFGSQGELRDSLDSLSRIASAMKNTSQMANTSRTAGTQQFLSLLNLGSAAGGGVIGSMAGGAPGAAIGTVAGMAAPTIAQNVSARLLTSPVFVRWLGSAVPSNGVPAHLARLTAIANNNPDLKPEIESFLSAFQQRYGQPSPQQK